MHFIADAQLSVASAATNGDELETLLGRCALRDQQALADLYAPVCAGPAASVDAHAVQSSQRGGGLCQTLWCERPETCAAGRSTEDSISLEPVGGSPTRPVPFESDRMAA